MSERLICRFCDKSNWRILFDASTHAQQVECASCLARGPLADSLDNAIAAWGRRAPSAEQLEVLRRVWQPHTQSNVDRMSEKDIAEEISCAVESAEQQSDQLSLDGDGGVTRGRDAERQQQEPVALIVKVEDGTRKLCWDIVEAERFAQSYKQEIISTSKLYTHQQPQLVIGQEVVEQRDEYVGYLQMIADKIGLEAEPHQTYFDRLMERIDFLKQPQAQGEPIDMVLYCPNPNCGEQHIDAPDDPYYGGTADENGFHPRWDNPPHRSHLCAHCGCTWRPADVATNGVAAIKTKGKADTWDGKTRAAVPDLLPIIMRYCADTMYMDDCRNMQREILEQFGLELH